MKNELYRKVLVPAAKSVDGEYPTTMHLVHESSGYAVFVDSFDKGVQLIEWLGQVSRDKAIEYAVTEAEARARNVLAGRTRRSDVVEIVVEDPGDPSVGVQSLHESVSVVLHDGGWDKDVLRELSETLCETLTAFFCEHGGKAVPLDQYNAEVEKENRQLEDAP